MLIGYEAGAAWRVEALLTQVDILGHSGIADFVAHHLFFQCYPRGQGVNAAAPHIAAAGAVIHQPGRVTAAQVKAVVAFHAGGGRVAPGLQGCRRRN